MIKRVSSKKSELIICILIGLVFVTVIFGLVIESNRVNDAVNQFKTTAQ